VAEQDLKAFLDALAHDAALQEKLKGSNPARFWHDKSTAEHPWLIRDLFESLHQKTCMCWAVAQGP